MYYLSVHLAVYKIFCISLFNRLSADVLSIFTIFLAIVFSENNPIYSNKFFWNFPRFSTFCLNWKLPSAIFLSFSWDDKCKFTNNSPKTITRKMLFFWRHLQKVGFNIKGFVYFRKIRTLFVKKVRVFNYPVEQDFHLRITQKS